MTTTRLEVRVALITGSDSRIGQAAAIAFANEDADLIVDYLHDADGCGRRFNQLCKHAGSGSKIINASSVRADISNAEGADDDCSKGAIRHAHPYARPRACAPQDHVNSLDPGMVLTAFDQPAIDDPDLITSQVQSIPRKRAVDPSEIARLAVFLASSDADCVTGSTATVNEGPSRNHGERALPVLR